MANGIERGKRIYVAGHEGMLGAAFMRRLVADGFDHLITAPRGSLDLSRQQQVDAFFDQQRPEIVILAAGRVGGIIENRNKPWDFIQDNLSIQLNVMNAGRRSGVSKLIFFASSCMYPRECDQPMREELLLTGSLEPTSQAYAMAKLAGVQSCLAFNQQEGETRFIPVIPNTIYGPGDNFDLQRSHVLPALIRRFHDAKGMNQEYVELWGSGKPRRELIYVDDVVDAVIFLLGLNTDSVKLPINIGAGKDYSIAELAQQIATVIGYQGGIEWDTSKPDGAPRKLLDSSRINGLGWWPRWELMQGIVHTYCWYEKFWCSKES